MRSAHRRRGLAALAAIVAALALTGGTAAAAPAPAADTTASAATGDVRPAAGIPTIRPLSGPAAVPAGDIDRRVQNCYSSVTYLSYWQSEDNRIYNIYQARWTSTIADEIRIPYGYWGEIRTKSYISILQGNEWYPIASGWHGYCVFIHTD